MRSPLDPTFGFWLISVWLQTLLQGCGLLQTWLYFHWYPKDHWGVKTMVISLVLIETFQVVVFFQVTYFYLITRFGDLKTLFTIEWQDSAQLLATYLSAFIVQMYFGYCIYVLDKKNIIPTLSIAAFALMALGAGLAQTIITTDLRSFLQLDKTNVSSTIQAAGTLLCDMTITWFLVRNLGKHKGQVKATNSMLNTLMINAVNRGALTTMCAALNLILFLSLPGTFYFFIGLEMSGKLYMNSALATLNSRQHMATTYYNSSASDHNRDPSRDWNMDRRRISRLNEDVGHGQVCVIISKHSETHSDFNQKSIC